MAKISNELKTGVAVLGSVLLLLFVFYRIGALTFHPKGYTVKVEFNRIGGVKQFAPVRLSGMEIGELKARNLDTRGNRWSAAFETERDPYFGLDWTRNMAVALARARHPPGCLAAGV